MTKKLQKSTKNKMLFGVCSGIAEYFKCDPTLVRLIFIIITLLKGAGVLLYLIAAVVMPAGEYYSADDDIDNMKSANVDDSVSDSKAPHSDEEFNNFFKK